MSFSGSTFSTTGKTKFLKIQWLRQPENRLLKYAASALRPTNFVLYFSPFLNKHFDLRDYFWSFIYTPGPNPTNEMIFRNWGVERRHWGVRNHRTPILPGNKVFLLVEGFRLWEFFGSMSFTHNYIIYNLFFWFKRRKETQKKYKKRWLQMALIIFLFLS